MNAKKQIHPPRWAERLLERFCPEDSLEEVQGDLAELYAYWIETQGKRAAHRRYAFTALRLLRPFRKRKKSPYSYSSTSFTPYMLHHYFTIAFRNILRQKAFSIINGLGLALGMACSLLIFLWVQDERSIDNFHVNGKQLFSIYSRSNRNGQITAGHHTPPLLPGELKRILPEAEYVSGFGFINAETFQVGDKIQKMQGSRAGADFFKMFSFPLLQGKAETALVNPSGIAISRKMAQIYFGSPQQAMGQVIRHENKNDLVVSAVFENLPPQTAEKFDYLINWESWLSSSPFFQSWGLYGSKTYIQLRSDADPIRVEEKIRTLMTKYDKNIGAHFTVELGLQQVGNMYLYSDLASGRPQGGRIEYVRLFTGVALFTLLIACINFMNLATSSSIKRAKEVGVRKVVGSNRSSLIWQFIAEALLITTLAIVASLLLLVVVLPLFNQLTDKEIVFPFANPLFWLTVLGLLAVTGFTAGSYPAFFLSSLRPIQVLKGSVQFTSRAKTFRQGLVIFQFVLSILLIIGSLVVSRQTSYLQTKHLGYDRENLLYLNVEGELGKKYALFKQELSNKPGIKMVDRISHAEPQSMDFATAGMEWEGKDPSINLLFTPVGVGYDYVKLMNLQLVAGRDFSREMATDSLSYLVNEAAVEQMGMKDPIGKSFTYFGKKGKIIGVLKNFHYHSLHQPIGPLVARIKEDLNIGAILVRTQPGQTQQALQSLQRVCQQLSPNYPFAFSFVDEQYAQLYKSEQIITGLIDVFAGLAIVISCLGLLGLATFSAAQRRKEMGIRKVLGASLLHLVGMFSKDFLSLVTLSFVIATPIAWYAMSKWLENYAFRIDLAWWIFALAGMSALLISLLTISFQTIKAALANPVKALRNE